MTNSLHDNVWHERFSGSNYYYGTAPNDFLKAASELIPVSSRVISLGEGEGRNAVFLAEQGHRVTAVDIAQSGLDKLSKLAQARGVEVTAVHADLGQYALEPEAWDAAINIFCHMPKAAREHLFLEVVKGLKSGGLFIAECYSTEQLRFGTGGPKAPELLFTIEEFENSFAGFDFIQLAQVEREIYEGEGHNGLSSVIQVIARKP